MLKAYKVKLKPNAIQEQTLGEWLGICRYVYNLCLEVKQTSWKSKQQNISRFDLQKQLTEAKQEFAWLKQVQSQVLQTVIQRLDLAYQSFFRKGGYPRWAKRGEYNSFLFPQSVKLSTCKTRLILPKFGEIRFFKDRLPKGEIKTCSIIQELDGWYASIVSEEPAIETYPASESQVGLDMGVTHFCTLSTGEQIANIKLFDAYRSKLNLLQRSLARKKKGSTGFAKVKKAIGKLFMKWRNVRNDYLHKLSTRLVKEHGSIYVEALKLKNMTASAKGNAEEHGKNVKQKSGLNRSLLDVGIGKFLELLEYKSKIHGRTYVKVNPKHTSQKCYVCNHVSKDNRKTQSNFECEACGHKDNADINASKNIKRLGQSLVSLT